MGWQPITGTTFPYIREENEQEEPLLVDVKIQILHALFDKFGSFSENVEPNRPVLPPLPRVRIVVLRHRLWHGVPEAVRCHDMLAEHIFSNGLGFVRPTSNSFCKAGAAECAVCSLHDTYDLVLNVDDITPQVLGADLALPQHIGAYHVDLTPWLLVC